MQEIQTLRTDVLVIGTEGAGARAALEAVESGCDVVVITKSRLGKSGATQCAPGDYAINSQAARRLGLEGDPSDSWEAHFEDTLEAGQRLNDVTLARVLAEGAETGLSYLMDLGVPWSWLGKYPGHRYPRGAMVGTVGKTGTSLLHGLHRALRERRITVLEDTFACDLLLADGSVVGCVALYVPSGEMLAIRAGAVILATGGGSRIYSLTSGPEEATGDGMAMAYRAGAALADMEFVQFSPYTMIAPQGLRGHQSFVYEYFCVLESWLLNCFGQRFMVHWDPVRMERSTRDIVSIAMMTEILAGRGSQNGGVYVSVSHLPGNLLDQLEAHYFPGLQVGSVHLRDFGIDPQRAAFEVAPGAHFFMGGVAIDARCASTVPGLFAAGEVAAGVHGANRLSGNALTETQVFGAIAGRSAAKYAVTRRSKIDMSRAVWVVEHIREVRERQDGVSPFTLRAELQTMAWRQAGVIRNRENLSQALAKVQELEASAAPRLRVATLSDTFNIELVKALEAENMILVLKAIISSALARQKSCGAHYRTDSLDDVSDQVHYIVQCSPQGMQVVSQSPGSQV